MFALLLLFLAFLLLLPHGFVYFGDDFLGVEGKVGLHHPVVVGGFLFEYRQDGFALVFTEVQHLPAMLVDAYMSGKVGPWSGHCEFAQCFNVVHYRMADCAVAVFILGILVSVELCLKYLVGRQRVGIG